MTTKPINFGAGPGKIPEDVLKEAQQEFLAYEGIEFSVTELSHRSDTYAKINETAQNDLRELLNVPSNYKIIFLHGGGQGLFAAVAMNLMGKNKIADYAVTGIWSQVAANEAKRYGQVNLVFPTPDNPGNIPEPSTWTITSNASYVYYCDNETIQGVEYPFIPDTKGVPLVADMSSNLMTRKFDISKFGVVIAAVQKNLGTAGLGIVIIREDLLGNALDICPSILNFKQVSDYNSILNTPPIFPIYLHGKVLKWVKKLGGLEAMENESKRKSQLLYSVIDSSNDFYQSTVPVNTRSRTNVTFRIKDKNEELESDFLKKAEEKKMFQLKGHSLVGGIRVSLYNAITYEDVEYLVDFMKEFQSNNA
ncbi:hypothetical protein ABEB36_005085 [Hypothenemus hampei]|uniref:phosphoserine transaminase n=1 Tax=Hypothenemus hampei TaxID=57062 RepID=A0ABD1EWX4_HYPHA